MGIAFSHGAASWSYTGFSHFRTKVAAMEGIDLHAMASFTGNGRPWRDDDTTLRPLLDHPDDEGELTPDECAKILPRLREIHAEWAVSRPFDYDTRTLPKFIDGLEQCVAAGEPLKFH